MFYQSEAPTNAVVDALQPLVPPEQRHGFQSALLRLKERCVILVAIVASPARYEGEYGRFA